MTDFNEPLHGSFFAYNGSGCLLIGPSGTGKSRLVADAMMMGARLVADDRVQLLEMMGLLSGAPVPELTGILELRNLAIIKVNDILTKHVISLVVELDPAADARLPELETRAIGGITVPYLRVPPVPHISAAGLLHYLKAMQEKRVLPTDWRPKAV